MSAHGIILIDVLGLLLLAFIVNLARTKRLHVAYGVIWFLTTLGVMVLVSVPPLLAWVTRAVGALFPASALSLLAFVFIFVVLIFFSVQLSTLASRQAELVQALALRNVLERARGESPAGSVEEGREPPPAAST